MKLCKDCAHCKIVNDKNQVYHQAICTRPGRFSGLPIEEGVTWERATKPSLWAKIKYFFANTESVHDLCGPEAKHFKPVEPAPESGTKPTKKPKAKKPVKKAEPQAKVEKALPAEAERVD